MTSSVVDWLLAHAGATALVLSRACGLAWTAPALATPGLGWRFRLLLVALLGAILVPVVGPAVAAPGGWGAIVRACLVEGGVGAALGSRRP